MDTVSVPEASTKKPKVCVTGASGYVASALVKLLLRKGYSVHATVRDPENRSKVEHLLKLPGADAGLHLFKADLLEEGSFDAAVAGCEGVFHVASPLSFHPTDPEDDVIKPAVKGTLNILKSCRDSTSVRRVVITSSASTLPWKAEREKTVYVDESAWSDSQFLRSEKPAGWPYYVAKTEAEKAALEFGYENGLDVLTLVASVLVGPWLTSSMPASVGMVMSLLTPDPSSIGYLIAIQMGCGTVPLVHVDDICEAHVFIYEMSTCSGRYVCCASNIKLSELARHVCKKYPMICREAMDLRHVEAPFKIHISSRRLMEVGFQYRHTDVDSMLDDTVECMRGKGLLL